MTLHIVHLYGDVMNTYGDWGNIATLTYRAKKRGVEVVVQLVSLGDELKPGQADFIFFGGGQDAGQGVVAQDLGRLSPTIREDVENGTALLSICGGYQLLGSRYVTGSGEELPGANVLPVETIAGQTRMMHNMVVALNPQLDIDRSHGATLVGFENHSGQTKLLNGAISLGRVLKGSGNNGTDGTEGVVYKHAIGSYLHGSCLPKNPHLADWLLGAALRRKYSDIELEPLDDSLEWQAHQQAIGLKA